MAPSPAASYAKGELEPPLLEQTIADNFDRTVAAHPDHEALVEFATGRRWTYRELNHDVDLFARGLIAGGIAKGDRIGVWAPNCAEWTIAQYATAKVGAILVNVNPSYRTHEFAYAVNQSGMRMLIAAESFKTSDYRAMVEETSADCPGLERVVYIGTSDWADVVEAGQRVDSDVVNERMRTLRPDDPINIQYTSGTTGYPKGATLSHRNILNNGYLTTELINFTHEDRLCIPVPFYHCFGMVMGNLGCTSHGATMVIPAPGFDPETHAARHRRRELHGGVRRPDHVHRDAEPPDLRRARPVQPAHRDHGRLDLPGRGDEALHQRHAHARGRHRLRHDRDVTGLVPDPGRRRPGAAHRLDRPGAPAPGDQDRRPGHRRDRRARRSRVSSAPGATR